MRKFIFAAVAVAVTVGSFLYAKPEMGQAAAAQPQSERLNAFFQEVFDKDVDESPMFQGYLGIKKDYGQWDDLSEKHAKRSYERAKADLAYMRANFDYDTLPLADQESYRIFELTSEEGIRYYENWRHHGYPLNQMFGWHTRIPSFLITVHRIDTIGDAEDYISRLDGVKQLAEQIVDDLTRREAKGVVPPEFVFAHLRDGIGNMLKGAPLTEGEAPHPLWTDFSDKVDALEIDEGQREELKAKAHHALATSFRQGFESLLAFIDGQEARATTDAGAWKLPRGVEYYEARLRYHTTTDMTADEIHELGLREVARIHEEMRELIRDDIGFEGTLHEFFELSKTSEKFRYPDTDEARRHYLQTAREYLAAIEPRLPEAFNTKHKAPVEIRPVEAFREKTAGIGFYQQPTPDGSRPGIFYVNLYKMEDVPKTEIEALIYHETLPGHHMQISIAQELEGLPDFRKHANFTAYIEGWGLYSELLPKEMGGFYQDPYSDFGRLTMELWRAIRLVVDTGIHARKWSREAGIAYIKENYPASEGEAVKAVERYIVMPGQATSYKIGMLKFLEVREAARALLGEQFNLGEFHDTVLLSGPLPLHMVEAKVRKWAEAKAKKQ